MKKRTGYLYKRGSTYYLEYKVDGTRHRQSLNTGVKRDAEIEASRIMAPYHAEETVDIIATVKTRLERATATAAALGDSVHLGEAWQCYMGAEKRKAPGPGTLKDYEAIYYAFKRWFNETEPEACAMRDVTTEHCRAFLKHLDHDRKLSGDRVNKHLVFLRAMFALLLKPAALLANPWDGIQKKEHTASHRRPLTVEEMKAIIEAAEGELKTLFMLGTFTGLRMGDCATLKWGEVDLVRAIIHRIPRKTSRKGVAVTIGIPAILGAHLATLPRQGPFIVPELARMYLDRKEYLSRRIQAHFVKCGIDTQGEGAGKRASCIAGFHSLRHSFVSMHAQAGTSQAIMQKLVGHGNAAMTQHYTTIDETTARTAAAALPVIIGDAEEKRDPIPAWAKKLIKGMSAKNWKERKTELMKEKK